jgi:hypothetical protein
MIRRALTFGLLAMLTGGCSEDGPKWGPKEKAEYEEAKRKADEEMGRKLAADRAAQADAEAREEAALKTMPDREFIARAEKLLSNDCNESACLTQRLAEAKHLRGAGTKRSHNVTKKIDTVIDRLNKAIAATAEMNAALGEYKAHIDKCCNAPKFMHSDSTKAQCRAWGLAKCVD